METKVSKYWKTLAIILIATNISLAVFLYMGRPSRPAVGDGPGQYITEKLKFSKQQEIEFNKLKNAHHEAIETLRREGTAYRNAFFGGLISDTPVSKQDSAVNKIAENQRQIELTTYRHFEDVKKLCTAEQKNTFNEIILEVIGRMKRPDRRPR